MDNRPLFIINVPVSLFLNPDETQEVANRLKEDIKKEHDFTLQGLQSALENGYGVLSSHTFNINGVVYYGYMMYRPSKGITPVVEGPLN